MNRKKITVVGAGNVGATCALYLAQKALGDIVLIDIVEGVPQGKALDIMEATPVFHSDSNVVGTNKWEDTKNSDMVIVTAGLPRKPGMSREDLLKMNADIVGGIAKEIKSHSPNAFVIVVSNPIDIMVYHLWKITGFPTNKVVGQAGILDSSRYATFIAMELGVSVQDISPMVLGGHGDSMVPIPHFTTVSGIPITELIAKDRIDQLSDRARKGGGEIVELLKTGSAYYAPAAATVQMAESIIKDQKRILPCSSYLTGQYGVKDLYIGVPVQLGKNGVEKIHEIKLDAEDLSLFQKSAEIYKENLSVLGY